jgi:hypothetical protein
MKTARTPQSAAPTPIVLLACGSRDTTVLEMIIQRFLSGEFVIVGQSRAEMAIIDGDSATAKKAMTEWRIHRPDAVALMLTLKPGVDSPQLVHFRKPIDVDGLIAVLKKLRAALLNPVAPLPSFRAPRPVAVPVPAATSKETASPRTRVDFDRPVAAPVAAPVVAPIAAPVAAAPKVAPVVAPVTSPVSVPEPISAHHQVSLMDNNTQDLEGRDYCGSAEDVPADLLHTVDCLRPDQAIQLYFDTDTRLLGLLRLAGKLAQTSKQATCIRGLERPLIVLPDTPMSVISPIKDGALRALCNTSLFSETVGLGMSSARHPDDVSYGYDELLWKVTLWTARGRLPRGADPHQPVRLRSTPDFARFTATPYAEAICRLWTQEDGLSPVATAARLRIAQRYVFALYSALRMLDLIETRPTPRVGESAPQSYADAVKTSAPKSRHSLLQGILMKLDNAA